MNTLSREEIGRLEGLLDGASAGSKSNNRSRQSLILFKLGLLSVLPAVLFFVCSNPHVFAVPCCLLLLVVLTVSCLRSAWKALGNSQGQNRKAPLFAFGVFLLSILGVSAACLQQPGSTSFVIPQLNSGAANSDPNLGTLVVGAKLPGLSLKNSQLTGHVDTNSLTSALYWTMDFANSSQDQQEARARIALPEGAAVSRVTLWINGVAQEAAFNSSTRTQAAYQWIANTGRDPLLITETKKGEVFLQAFPVPANGEMKVRFGITSPLTVQTRREFRLVPPRIVESDFTGDQPESKIKLESNSPIESTSGQLASVDHGGSFVLEGTRNGNAPFLVHRQGDFTTFASRATHSAGDSFIKERLQESADGLRPIFEKSQTLPECSVAFDFPTASRMSTLWAAAEARKCAALNEWETAAQLGTAYRVVTPASGAVVLETESDYDYTGLQRSFYSVVPSTAKAGNPNARKANSVDAAMERSARRDERGVIDPHTMLWNGQAPLVFTGNDGAPTLQGASNGTIAPQGADATYVMGVNTAGIVRPNNLANFEALLNAMIVFFEITAALTGAILLLSGLRTSTTRQAAKRILTGSSWVMVGILMPSLINYVIASISDANVF